MDRIPSTPWAARSSYTSMKAAGFGREVLTGSKSRSARVTRSWLNVSAPSANVSAPMITCSGMTVMPWRSTSASSSEVVESVTTAKVPGMRPRLDRRSCTTQTCAD